MSIASEPSPGPPHASSEGLSLARGAPHDSRRIATRRSERRETSELIRKLSIVAFTRVIVVTLALAAVFLFAQLSPITERDELAIWQYVLISVAYALSIVYALLLRRRLGIVALAYAQIVLDTLIAGTLVSMTGGIESVFTFVYVFTVLGASMTLSRRGAVVAAVSYLLTFGTILILQLDHDIAPTVDAPRAVFSFFMYSLGISLVAFLSSTLAENLEIAGRRLAEKQVDYQQLEELHAVILRSLPAGLMTVDAEGVVRYANESALAILRRSALDTIGVNLASVVSEMGTEWDRFQHQGGRDRDRERFEASFERGDGRAIRIGFSFAPLSEESGLGLGSIVVFQDVTEIVRLKEAYERAERLASVGKIAAGLAHEVRNPLASMCASIEVLKSAINPPEPMKRLMTNVVKEADRLNALITDFLAFARPREPDRRRADVSATVASVIDLLEHDQLFSKLEIVKDLEPGVFAPIDANQMRQVLWNLARNAAEAMLRLPGGTLTIATHARAGKVEIRIRDTGPGIPPDQVKRIFDPFYTTKESGSGLGLAIVHSIVEAHGGRIHVESKLGAGAEMTIVLPTGESVLPRVEEQGPSDTPLSMTTSDLDLLSSSGPRMRNHSRGT